MESVVKTNKMSIDSNDVNKTVMTLNDLPNEIIDKVFRLLSFEAIAKNRIVCKRFNQMGSNILNSEFQVLRNYTQQRFQSIKSQMPRRESARRKHPLARESDIIETLHMRLTLLQMTFSKHIERMHCCFFSGEILDEVHRILNYVKQTPVLSRAYKVTDELFDLSTMAMEYFKEHIEPTLPEINYFGVTDYFLDYSSTLTGSPQTQLSLMDNTTNDIHHNTSLHSNKKRSAKSNTTQVESSSSHKNDTILLKRRLRNMELSVKRNNSQIIVLKRDLINSKKKWSQQQRQANNIRTRFDDYDKKFETTNRKLSAVLEELSKCKTELQYWRSKSPPNGTPTQTGKPTHCRCADNSQCLLINENNDTLLLPEVFQPICEKQTTSTQINNNDTNDLPIVHRVQGQHCKRKLNYFDEKKCKLRKS